MSNFIYYEKLQDYEEQVRKAKEYDKLQQELQRKDNILSELKELIIKDINFPELVDKEKIENIIKELEENK